MATIASASVAAALAALPYQTRTGTGARVIVAAHRGGAGDAPENTLLAFRRAMRLGADYVELDVRETSDGGLVLMHDRTVDRATNGSGEVASLTSRQVADLRVRAADGKSVTRERVPTFEEAVKLCRGRIGLYVDHKSAPVAKVLATLDRHRFRDRVVVYGGLGTLREYRRLRPDLLLMPGHPDSADAMARVVSELKPLALDGYATDWSTDQVAEAHRLGATVWMDVMGPTDSDEGYAGAVAMGADAIQTDYPGRLIHWLRTHGRR